MFTLSANHLLHAARGAAGLLAGGLLALYVSVGTGLAAAKPHYPGAVPLAADGAELIVRGVNWGGDGLQVWVRVDGVGSTNFATRANILRAVPKGRFTLTFNHADLTDAHHRPIDLSAAPAVYVFARYGETSLVITDVAWRTASPLVRQGQALDFGAIDGPVQPGFSKVTPDDPRLHGRHRAAVTRLGVDALSRDGIKGIEAVTLDLPRGLYGVRLWLEDLGEWEYVPRQLRHRVRINGRTVLDRDDDPQSWIKGRYLRLRDAAWQPGDTAWATYGARRAGLGPFATLTDAEGLRIELAGDSEGAVFMSGILVVPLDEADRVVQLEAEQAERFNAAWPVVDSEPRGDGLERLGSFAAARGETVWVELRATSGGALAIEEPFRNGIHLPIRVRTGFRRLIRPYPQSPYLQVAEQELRPAGKSVVDGQSLVLEIAVPDNAPPGAYNGTVTIGAETMPFAINVGPVTLPPSSAPAGVYLEDPPYHAWFDSDPVPDRACRLATLASLGLHASAPPLTTPTPDDLDQFAGDVALAYDALKNAALVAYTPLKRLFAELDEAAALDALRQAMDRGGDRLIWSAADEPSNVGPHGQSMLGQLAAIRDAVPDIRLAGHLNAPEDQRIAHHFDVALINPGYGIDASDLRALDARGVDAWIYNTGPARLATGFYGWRVGSSGYLLWHGMLPTADPFDPTDGREGDAILLPLIGDPCSPVPTLDRRLIEIAEGVRDRRWLTWLDARAHIDPAAAALQSRIAEAVPDRWDLAKDALDDEALDGWRAEIAALAWEATQ